MKSAWRPTAEPSDLRAAASQLTRLMSSALLSILKALLNFPHYERDQDPLGPNPRRQHRRARLRLGGDGMDSLAARLSAAAWTAVVRAVRLAGLSAARVLLVVVRLRCLCARCLRRRRLYRGLRRCRRDGRGCRHVGMASPRGQEDHDLRLRALG